MWRRHTVRIVASWACVVALGACSDDVSVAGSDFGTGLSEGSSCPKAGRACVAGTACIASVCTTIICTPNETEACYSGAEATRNVGACREGQRRCDGTGTRWIEACEGEVLPLPGDSCLTPEDDDCDGVANPAELCGLGTYAYNLPPDCGAWCYADEDHNLATTGSVANVAGYASFAPGQLVDGLRGADQWAQDNGYGPAHEWVGWIEGEHQITLRMPEVRTVQRVIVGMSNTVEGGVTQPSVVQVRTSLNGSDWSAPTVFSLGDGSLEAIPAGKRGDVLLSISPQQARYIRLSITRTGWALLDELTVQ